jgi:hypothetical protein
VQISGRVITTLDRPLRIIRSLSQNTDIYLSISLSTFMQCPSKPKKDELSLEFESVKQEQ